MANEIRDRCVHCGECLVGVTRDHVFPSSWYPDTTSPEVQRWTVPSCDKCNNRLGALEKLVFSRLVLCVDPRKAEAVGLSAKVMRSMGIGVEGLKPREAQHRRAQKLKIINATKPYDPGTETLPGLGPHPDFPEDGMLQIGIPAGPLNEVIRKIVRGCEYVLAEQIVEKPYGIDIYFAPEDKVPELIARILRDRGATTEHLGPGFCVTRVSAHDEPGTVFYKIVLWGTLVCYATVLPQYMHGGTEQTFAHLGSM